MEVIGEKCFQRCRTLTIVNFGEGSKLRELGGHAFEYSMIKKIVFPPTLQTIGEYCFSMCRDLKEIQFQEEGSLTTIGERAFSSSSCLDAVHIPASVTTIGKDCFKACIMLYTTNVTFAEGFTGFDPASAEKRVQYLEGIGLNPEHDIRGNLGSYYDGRQEEAAKPEEEVSKPEENANPEEETVASPEGEAKVPSVEETDGGYIADENPEEVDGGDNL